MIEAMDLSEAVCSELLDPLIWQEGLERFAAATNLAVLLTDVKGRALGSYINCQPTWSILWRERAVSILGCPFCIEPMDKRGACVSDALSAGFTVTTSDGAGLVHLTIPLSFGGRQLGALVAGQVFDRYPDHLLLHKVSTRLPVSAEALWQCARLELPIRRETLHVYGRLLETFANAFLQARYQSVTDATRLGEMVRLHDLSTELAVKQRDLAAQREQQIELTSRILEDTRKQLNTVNARLVSAHEEEHERMARELHDSIGHGMVVLQFEVHALHRTIPSTDRERLGPQFETISHHIGQIADEVRHLSHQLHPSVLTDLGLEEALRQVAEKLGHSSLKVDFAAQNVPEVIEPAISLGIYRIVQEAVQNVVRHSGSTMVNIKVIGTPTALEVYVVDNGKGFDVSEPKRGLGLINIAHRAELLGGVFAIETHPGQGAKLLVRVPLAPWPTTT